MLKGLERRVSAIYSTDPSLLRIQKKYAEYMKKVKEQTADLYDAYVNAEDRDEKAEAKKAYGDEVARLTIHNRKYNRIITEFTNAIATANQRALDLVNAEMTDIYTINYNQVLVDCKRVGIEVDDGGTESSRI